MSESDKISEAFNETVPMVAVAMIVMGLVGLVAVVPFIVVVMISACP